MADDDPPRRYAARRSPEEPASIDPERAGAVIAALLPRSDVTHHREGAMARLIPNSAGDLLRRVDRTLDSVQPVLSRVDGTLGTVDGTLSEVGGTLTSVDGTLTEVGGTLKAWRAC